jgi:hypothetical protein
VLIFGGWKWDGYRFKTGNLLRGIEVESSDLLNCLACDHDPKVNNIMHENFVMVVTLPSNSAILG